MNTYKVSSPTYYNSSWNELYSKVATTLDKHKIDLEGLFFTNTPQACIFITSDKKNIFDHPASYYSKTATRKVLFEKINYRYSVKNFSTHVSIAKGAGETILESKYLTAGIYQLRPKEGEDVFTSLKAMLEPIGKNFAVFLYVYDNIFEVLEQTKTIRMCTLELKS